MGGCSRPPGWASGCWQEPGRAGGRYGDCRRGRPLGHGPAGRYRKDREAGESLADYLEKRVFAAAAGTCVDPDPEDRAGFQTYIARYKAGLAVEKAAAEALA